MSASGQSYGRIVKSSALLGGSSLINVVLGMVRVKVLAVELGPALFGVMSLYSSLTSMIGTFASFGIGASGVREIAQAVSSGDEQRVARMVAILKRIAWLTGLFGLLVTLVAAWPASWWTFGDHDHGWAIAILGITVLFAQLQAGQGAVLSGLRRIRDISMINVIGALWSTLLAIPLLLLYRDDGIVPFLLAVAAGQLAASWWYARRVRLQRIRVTWRECAVESVELLRLGGVIVVSGLGAALSAYLIRLILQFQAGESAVGLYQSAFTVSGIYVGFILQAMSGDYFPRLAGAAENQPLRNQLVSEQAEMAMLLAAPGLVVALVLSELLIWLLYSDRFIGASDILRWQVLGLLGRIVSWPIGFILMARSDKSAYLLSEMAAAAVHVLLVWLAVSTYGAVGAGVGFAGQYVFHIGLMYWLVRTRHGYVWSTGARNAALTGVLLVALSFATTFFSDSLWRYGTGALLVMSSAAWAIRGFVKLLGRERIVSAIRDWAGRLIPGRE